MQNALSNIMFDFVVVSFLALLVFSLAVLRMKNKAQIHYVFAVMLLSSTIWALGAIILEFGYLNGRPTELWAVCLAYVGVITTPLAALFVGLTFAKARLRLNWKYSLLLIEPVVAMVLLATNNMHHLFYTQIDYATLTRSEAMGQYFIVHTAFSYGCILTGMGYLVFFSIKNAGFFSRQSILIFLGIIISTTFNGLLTIQAIDVSFSTNMLAFAVTLILFFFAIIKYDFLNLVPIALQTVVDHISDSFIILDRNKVIIDFNKSFIDQFGHMLSVRRKATLAACIDDPATSAELTRLLQRCESAAGSADSAIFEATVEMPEGEKNYTVEVTPLTNRGVVLNTVILFKDVSQLKKAAATIQRNAEILAEKERLASLGQLIGGIAHNLKTPIMSISGGIEGLQDLIQEYDDSIGDEQVTDEDHHQIASDMMEWIGKIRPHCSYMSDIISTVKGQTAQFSLSADSYFALDELIKRVDLLMTHELKRFHCNLQISYDVDRFTEIHGDINSLVQIMDNLIINSIHAYEGETGTIELSIRKQDDYIVFSLKDYGKGIPYQIQEKLFREMVTTKGKGGTGLGLYMSNTTIKAQFGGTMQFESTPGQGSTFMISIPIQAQTLVAEA